MKKRILIFVFSFLLPISTLQPFEIGAFLEKVGLMDSVDYSFVESALDEVQESFDDIIKTGIDWSTCQRAYILNNQTLFKKFALSMVKALIGATGQTYTHTQTPSTSALDTLMAEVEAHQVISFITDIFGDAIQSPAKLTHALRKEFQKNYTEQELEDLLKFFEKEDANILSIFEQLINHKDDFINAIEEQIPMTAVKEVFQHLVKAIPQVQKAKNIVAANKFGRYWQPDEPIYAPLDEYNFLDKNKQEQAGTHLSILKSHLETAFVFLPWRNPQELHYAYTFLTKENGILQKLIEGTLQKYTNLLTRPKKLLRSQTLSGVKAQLYSALEQHECIDFIAYLLSDTSDKKLIRTSINNAIGDSLSDSECQKLLKFINHLAFQTLKNGHGLFKKYIEKTFSISELKKFIKHLRAALVDLKDVSDILVEHLA